MKSKSHSPRLRYAAPLYLLSDTGRSGYKFLGFSIAGKEVIVIWKCFENRCRVMTNNFYYLPLYSIPVCGMIAP